MTVASASSSVLLRMWFRFLAMPLEFLRMILASQFAVNERLPFFLVNSLASWCETDADPVFLKLCREFHDLALLDAQYDADSGRFVQ